jgi:hypothetical protein
MVDLQQPSMFRMNGEPSAFVLVNPRQDVIDSTLDKADEEWKARYQKFVLEFAERATEPFSAEDVREAYLATPGLPHTDREQASGGIFMKLAKSGQLVKVGKKRSRIYGNDLTTYKKGAPANAEYSN